MSDLVGNPEDRFSQIAAQIWGSDMLFNAFMFAKARGICLNLRLSGQRFKMFREIQQMLMH